jgi:hypothetical protein
MNVTNRDQVLSECTIIGHREPDEWATVIDDKKPLPRRKQELCKQLKKVIADATPNVSLRETQALDEFIADC